MLIALAEPKFLWILCILADFCGLAHLTCTSSAYRLYKNENLASSLVDISSVSVSLEINYHKTAPDWYTSLLLPQTMSSVKNITSSSRRHADKPKARGCGLWINAWDVHHYCPSCRESNSARGKLPADPCMSGDPCQICETFSAEKLDKIASRRKYIRKPRDTHRPDLSADLKTGSE